MTSNALSEISEGFRISSQQEQVWFFQQAGRNQPYRAQCAVVIEGPLHPETLRAALCDVVGRHEILRTGFHRPTGMTLPVQVVNDADRNSCVAWSVEHLPGTGVSPSTENLIAELLRSAKQKPFDFERGPLLHASLSILNPSRHVLTLALPALCADRTTLINIVNELSRSYAARSDEEFDAEAGAETMQYADFSEWQNELFESEETEAGQRYWRQQRQIISSLIAQELPFERKAGQMDSPDSSAHFAPQSCQINLNAELKAEIARLSAKDDCSVPSFLLACWQVLLWKLTGVPNIVVGMTHDGRAYEEFKDALGLFTKSLPIHSRPGKEMSFAALMKSTEDARIEAAKWQEYFRWNDGVEDRFGQTELPQFFPYGFDYTEALAPLIVAEITLTVAVEEVCIDPFKVRLNCVNSLSGLRAEFQYDSALFDKASIELLSRQYEKLINNVVENPQTGLADVEILSDTERLELLAQWRETQVQYTHTHKLHELFEAQVLRSPDAIALVSEQERLSFLQLNEQANQLAHLLLSYRISPDSPVALLLNRSPQMMVSILAVLKAGAAYLPLDPDQPPVRLSLMLHDAAPRLLISDATTLPALGSPALDSLPVINLDTCAALLATQPTTNPALAIDERSLAYIIYTSGSTGKPKAVAVSHRAICNRLLWMQTEFPLTADDRVLQKTAYSFDASIWEMFVPLMSGAQVILAKAGGQRDSAYLVEVMEREAVTVLQMVPSMLGVLLGERGLRQRCVQLKRVFSGGEALTWETQEKFFSLFGAEVELVNLYGPTEASIDASYRRCSPEDSNRVRALIGRGISNMQLYVLDDKQRLTPTGAVGELFLGGMGLARGYLKSAEMTAERFVPNCFSEVGGERLYRTGDMVRRMVNGEMEYLGRVDQQLKVRGNRVELGEVEAAVLEQEGVREAVVIAVSDELGEQRLVAYVVMKEDAKEEESNAGQESVEELVLEELRRRLGERLPEYMIPSQIVLMAEMPRLANSKIDRNALPAPDIAGQKRLHPYVAPRTQVEEVLANLWSGVLGRKEIGIEDNFFDLGGHSLLATQLVSRVRKTFQVELPLRALFEAPTVAGIAEQIERLMRDEQAQQSPPIVSVPRDVELPLSFAQQRLWFLDQLQPGSAFYNLPAAIRLSGQLNVAALQRCFDEIVRRHESLRTIFKSTDGRPRQVIMQASAVPLALEDLQALGETEREAEAVRLATKEVQRPFDLSVGPLFRVGLLRLGEQDHILLLTLHHIISDNWSSGVLVREMVALYEAYAKGTESTLPELPIQYADFAHWQRAWLEGEALETQREFWRRQLAGAPVALELPTSRPRPPVQTFSGGRQSLLLPLALSESLKELSRKEGVTMFMLMLAAFKVLLSRYSGQRDIVVGSPIAGRNHIEIENLVGFFVNTLVLRTDLSGNPTFQELLARVRETSLGASAHQDLPFEKLVEELQPSRDLNRTPLFQVMFALQNGAMDSYELADLTLSPVAADTGTAKFELELYFQETKDGFTGTFEYNSDLFDKNAIERMAQHYERLLEEAVANPQRRILNFQMLTEAERVEQQLGDATTTTSFPLDSSFDQLFTAQVSRSPHAIALASPSAQLSYRQLDDLALALSLRLSSLGVGPDSLVALLDYRSTELLVAILALFKLGAAYLPLDPRHPPRRLSQIIQQSRTPLVLASEVCRPLLTEALAQLQADERPLVADIKVADSQPLATAESQPLATTESLPPSQSQPLATITAPQAATSTPHSTPANLAYVIYTSGSTGLPKGAMVTVHGMLNHLYAKIDTLGLSASDVVAQTASQCFDISVWQLLAALLVGAQVQLVPDEVCMDPARLLHLIEAQAVTVVEVVPSLLSAIVDELGTEGAGTLQQLRWMIATGEALPPQLCRRWLHQPAGQARLLNAYGPTECADDVTHYEVRTAPAAEVVSMAIGKAIANTRLYLLNEQMLLVPVGVSAELYVGGVGVGRGYVGDAAATAERFVPDPYSAEGGERLYRTGDVCRRREDGELEYVGRVDYQVKVRGYRIELGEIEAALREQAGVGEAVVVLRAEGGGAGGAVVGGAAGGAAGGAGRGAAEGGGAGEGRLVGYVVEAAERVEERAAARAAGMEGGRGLDMREVRAGLEGRLPEYMVPQALVEMERMPLTANGKIDRQALPAPDFKDDRPERIYVAPRSVMEKMVAEIWTELLGIEAVGVEDNFFNIGGHSLLATQVVSRLRQRLAIEIPLRTLFESPTIAALASAIEESQRLQTQRESPAIKSRKRASPDVNKMLAKLQELSASEARQLLDEMKNAKHVDNR